MSQLVVIVMAGGLGKRMNSNLPKVLHIVGNRPMLCHVIQQARSLNPDKIYIVVGQYKDIIIKTLNQYTTLDDLQFVNQPQPLGTGHAILCCRDHLLALDNSDLDVLIMSGDLPMMKSETLSKLVTNSKGVNMLVASLNDPSGYGRILEVNGYFDKIVEDKDCNLEQRKINKVNCGTYSIKCGYLCQYLANIDNDNLQKEYYLTQLIEIIKENEKVEIGLVELHVNQLIEIINVNTRQQLDDLNDNISINFSPRKI